MRLAKEQKGAEGGRREDWMLAKTPVVSLRVSWSWSEPVTTLLSLTHMQPHSHINTLTHSRMHTHRATDLGRPSGGSFKIRIAIAGEERKTSDERATERHEKGKRQSEKDSRRRGGDWREQEERRRQTREGKKEERHLHISCNAMVKFCVRSQRTPGRFYIVCDKK